MFFFSVTGAIQIRYDDDDDDLHLAVLTYFLAYAGLGLSCARKEATNWLERSWS